MRGLRNGAMSLRMRRKSPNYLAATLSLVLCAGHAHSTPDPVGQFLTTHQMNDLLEVHLNEQIDRARDEEDRQAAIASLELAFDRFAADEVIALTVARNEGSWGLMERLGMRRREELDFENADFDAENPVIIVYSIDRDDWQSQDA